MRVVLYTNDFEPITVLFLEEYILQYIEERGEVTMPVIAPLIIREFTEECPVFKSSNNVHIRAERFFYRNKSQYLLFTADEESAMLLKSVFLPGQYSEVQERERMAAARGFLKALELL